MTAEQRTEVLRLASLLATARVRKYAVALRPYSSNETVQGTKARTQRAQRALESYLDQLVEVKS